MRKLATGGIVGFIVAAASLSQSYNPNAQAAFPGFNGKIAFSAGDIYAVNPDGTGLAGLTTDGYDYDDDLPGWSPDGSRVAFVSDRDGNDEIYVMDADGSNQTRITYNPGLDTDPAWSPAGDRLLFASDRNGNWEIYVMNVDGSNVTRLTDDAAVDVQPDWSPVGDAIAFSSNRGGNFDIYAMGSDGSSPTNLTNNPASDAEPDFSPDGTTIGFLSNEKQNFPFLVAVFTMQTDGSERSRLSGGFVGAGGPSWSPDGTQITYGGLVQIHGSPKIFIISAAGGPATETVSGTHPDWQPLDQPPLTTPTGTPVSEPGAATATPGLLSPVAAPDTGIGSSGPGSTASILLAALVAVGVGGLALTAFVLRRRV